MTREFRKLAIVNRGEPAMRLMHAAREFARERGEELQTIALYTDPDRHAMFVREADEAVSLGSPSFVDPKDGQRKSRYLDYRSIERALVTSGAEAVWVGWGFVAEHPAFVELCDRLGVTFVGPPAEVMRKLGDKITAKKLAEASRVPVAPWSGGPVESTEEAREVAEKLGFPVMIKASSGGGGRGIRRVRSMKEMDEAFETCRSEALRGFGDPTVFIEKMVSAARHVEVQIIADTHGNVWPVGVRDCSVQRRNQKVIEESNSTALNSLRIRKVGEAAARLCKTVGYVNAGTVEFLYDTKERKFAFMEVNTRLQVEHPVTESCTGVDLVKLQLHVARGGKLEGKPPRSQGHAIEVRLNAEDPDKGFSPAPGSIELFRVPTGPGVRVDTGVGEGDSIPPDFDSMIAKIIAHGGSREEAIARMRRALAETTIVVRGGTTNKAYLLELLDRGDYRAGRVDIGWLDRLMESGQRVARPHAELALLVAAIEIYEEELDAERRNFLFSAYRGRPHVPAHYGRKVELRYGGNAYEPTVFRLGTSRYRVEFEGARVELTIESLTRFERRLQVAGRAHRVVVIADGIEHLVEVNGVPHRVSRDDGGMVRSASPAVVVSLRVKQGDEVKAGDTVAVLEAMKTEMPLSAPLSGKVRQIFASKNDQIEAGAPVVQLEPSDDEDEAPAAPRLAFESIADKSAHPDEPRPRCLSALDELQRMVLGYDVSPQAARRLLEEREISCAELAPGDAEVFEHERRLLEAFADIVYLAQREPIDEDGDTAAGVGRSPQDTFFTYCRGLDGEGQGLSPAFVERLKRAFAHYGVSELTRTRDLEDALVWITKSHSRVETQVAAVFSLLDRWLRNARALERHVRQEHRALLGRVAAVSARRFPALGDLAREVRYEFFDKPVLEAARRRVYGEVTQHLEHLARHPEAEDRQGRIDALVDCPQPLMDLLSERFTRADLAMRQLILEALTRRYYRIRELEDVRVITIEGHSMAFAEYEHEGTRYAVVTTHALFDRLQRAGELVAAVLRDLPKDHEILVDFYVRHTEGAPSGREALRESLERSIDSIAFPRRMTRIVASVTGVNDGSALKQTHFTFRPTGDGYREDPILRGLHPMMAKRLRIKALSDFLLERLPSAEDVYLFHAVARDNPNDERLFALAEVRDLTPTLDASGRVIALPHLERMMLEALAGIRRFQSTRPPHKRLFWNRVVLHTWPLMTLKPDDVERLARKLAPATSGLGLEKVVLRLRIPDASGSPRDEEMHFSNPTGRGVDVKRVEASDEPIAPLTPYHQKVVKMQRRGLNYPYEIVRLLSPESGRPDAPIPPGSFQEYDLDDRHHLVPVERPWGQNSANMVVGVITNYTRKHPEGMKRVILLGDPSRGLGSLAEAECRRIIAALDLAESMRVPLEWFAVSAGAKISMESGTENMDWIALVLRRIVLFTQDGHEINVIVHGVNVGAQPYWNAEATMLMHTRGILVMTADGAMVLTGKKALDYSGGVSAEDNHGIGGYDRVMGANGQAQYWARDVSEACRLLLHYYDHTYVTPDERFPRRAETIDPKERDVCQHPYDSGDGAPFQTIGEVFSPEHNPGRKRPFEIRRVMRAVMDQDHRPLERWIAMQDAEVAVAWEAHIGGYPVSLLGLESRPVPRAGLVPADGPEAWTAGTLFPKSSKKVARVVNAASGNRPLVVLANLSGFDGSPESMRNLQLEYGAEIGRAVVNFRGPIVFCVISRYHGGAFVVFSRALNESLEVSALEHTHASVIGGAPAAAVVFAREVEQRTKGDARIRALENDLKDLSGREARIARQRLAELTKAVRSEKLGEVASEFDKIHSVERALHVGSVQSIVPPTGLRAYLIDAVERGIAAELARGEGDHRRRADWQGLFDSRRAEGDKNDEPGDGADEQRDPGAERRGVARDS